MRTVYNELEDVKHKAYEIGIQLGIPHSKMVVFKQEGDILSAAVDFWLRGNVQDSYVPVTWGSIVAALESKPVGETGLAKTIREKHCCQQEEAKENEG